MKKKTQLKNNNLYQHESLWVVVCEYMWGYVNLTTDAEAY